MALRDELKKPRTPPRLRKGTSQKCCGTCRHFDGKGACRLYRYPVKAGQVSDSYAAAQSDNSMEGMMPSG